MTETPLAPVVSLQHAQKRFGAVHALDDGDIELFGGEVHGLVGENGAGKSTLVKILAGVHRADAGRLLIDGEEAIFDNAKQSQAAGIAIIFQEPTLFPDLSVAENIFVGVQPLKRFRRIDGRRMRREAAVLFEQLGVRLDPDRLARGLSIADQQLVEIAKALTTNARVIVMDEPTAALTTNEVERLFRIVETLRARGSAVLFISHRLDEIFEICERVTVMRDGRHVWTKPIGELTVQSVIRAMVGRDMDALFPKVPSEPGPVVLKVDRLTREGEFTDVSFVVRSGEIVALAGLVGAGRTEVARAIFGIDRWDAGTVEIDGRRLPAGSPSAAMAAGIALVPEDRRQQGLVMDFSIERNIALASLDTGPARGRDPPGLRARLRARLGASPPAEVREADQPGLDALGRQPAEDRAGEVARPQADAADRRRADARHRRRDEGGGAPPALRARGAGRRRPHDLLRAAGGAPHGGSDRRALRGPRHARVRAGRGRRGRDHARRDGTGRGGRMTSVAEEQNVVERRSGSHAFAEFLVRFRELGIVLALVIVVGGTTLDNHLFLSAANIQQILAGSAIIALLAIGETIVIITRNVDLSIGSILGISAYATGVLYVHHPDVALPVVFLLALAIGAVCGVVNGLIVTVGRVPSLVVTLGTLYIIRGIDGAWAGGNQVNASMLPESFNKIGYATVLGIPYLGWIAIIAVAVATYAMRSFRTARDFYAIGSDPDAARLAGIPVGSRVFLAFVLSGAIAGVTGALWLSLYASVDAIAGVGYEFQVIAAVVVGGVAIFGGSGTVLGAALGALLLYTINTALVVVNVSSFWSMALAGALLLAAIAFDRLVALRVAPAMRTRRSARA